MNRSDLLSLFVAYLNMDEVALRELEDIFEENNLDKNILERVMSEQEYLRLINEQLYPGGDPDYEWEWYDIDIVAEFLQEVGLGPTPSWRRLCQICGQEYYAITRRRAHHLERSVDENHQPR